MCCLFIHLFNVKTSPERGRERIDAGVRGTGPPRTTKEGVAAGGGVGSDGRKTTQRRVQRILWRCLWRIPWRNLWRNLLIILTHEGTRAGSRTDRGWRPWDWTAGGDQRGSDRRWRSGVRREEDDQTCGLPPLCLGRGAPSVSPTHPLLLRPPAWRSTTYLYVPEAAA